MTTAKTGTKKTEAFGRGFAIAVALFLGFTFLQRGDAG